nr:MAG TPA: hypothetical protein [Caudoviricetes sp.]
MNIHNSHCLTPPNFIVFLRLRRLKLKFDK